MSSKEAHAPSSRKNSSFKSLVMPFLPFNDYLETASSAEAKADPFASDGNRGAALAPWTIYFQHAASKPAMLAMEQPSYYSESQPRLASAAAVSLPRKVSFHVMATLLSFVGGDARPTFQPPAAGFLC